MANHYLDICDYKKSEHMVNFGLPFEIWSKIFGQLDFKMQNRTTLVCKSWLEMIRNDFVFSGELSLNSITKMEASEINSIISKWKRLKVLRALNSWHPQRSPLWSENLLCFPTVDLKILEIDFSLCPTLERVVVPVVAHTTIDGTGVSLYFDDQAIYGLGRMLPGWARVSKIWFDPQNKELQKLGLENISELCLELDEKTYLKNMESLETIGASMVNLDSLCIWIKYVKRDKYPNHNIDYCLPLLKNLPNNLHLELHIGDDPIKNEYFHSFVKQFASKISSLKVDIDVHLDEYLSLDYGWIRYFTNLEKLILEGDPLMDNINEGFDEDDVIEEFCQNPLSKLKEFRNPTNFYMGDKFLMRIHEAFPILESLIIDGNVHRLDTAYGGDSEHLWRVENLINVLQSLLSIKNFTFSNHISMNTEYGPTSDLSLVETANIFAASFDMIKQFPNESIVIIHENMYGYKIIKEKDMLPRIYHKLCDRFCSMRWSYHTVCKLPLTRKKVNIYTIINFFLGYESLLKEKVANNFNTKIVLIKHKDITVEETGNIFALLFDIIKKFPIEICLKVIDDVHGYRIIKEDMKEPRIYHRICEKDCKMKFSYHTICTLPEKPTKQTRVLLE